MRKGWSFLFLLAMVGFKCVVFGQATENPQQAGDDFMKAKDFQSALNSYGQVLKAGGLNANTTAQLEYKMALAYSQLKQFDLSLQKCDEALALRPNTWFVYLTKGICHDMQLKYDTAIAEYTKAIALLPPGDYKSSAMLYADIGWDEHKLNNNDKAMQADSMSVMAYPQYVRAYWLLGIIKSAQNKYQEAIYEFNTALFNANSTDSKLLLAGIYLDRADCKWKLKKYKEAINDYSSSILLNGKSRKAYWNRGAAYHENGDYNLATSDYTNAIAYSQGDNNSLSKLYDDRAVNEMAQNMNINAIEDDSVAIAMDPLNKSAYWDIASAYLNNGDFAQSNMVYRKLAGDYSADKKNLGYIQAQIADNEYFMKQYDKAKVDCDAAIAADNLNADALYCRAQILYKKMNKKKQAMADFNAILLADTSKKTIYYTFSLYYTGKADLAIDMLKNDLLIPNSISVNSDYYNLACLYSLMNKPDEANVYLKKAIESHYSKRYAMADDDLDNIRNTDEYKAVIDADN